MIKKSLFIVLLCSTFVLSATSSQWRGPNRNGIYPDINLLKTWPDQGPQLLWSITGIGGGFSSAAVANNKVYITGMENGNGNLFAFSLDGKLLWKKLYGPDWSGDHPGARSTPTIVDGHAYLVSGMMSIYCFDAEKGGLLWSVDMAKEFGAQNLQWGMTESPLVDGNNVICTPGGDKAVMAALDRNTGKAVWICKGIGDKSGYCSPVLVVHNGKRLIVTMTQKNIIGVDAGTGALLWQFPHQTSWDVNSNTPVYQDGTIYCVSGYGTGGVKLQLSPDGKSVKELWRNNTLDSQMGASLLLNGYIYGSGQNNRGWKCLDYNTGVEKWSVRQVAGKGNVISADGMLYLYGENGEVALVKPDPTTLSVVSSFKVTLGTEQHWAHLVIDNGLLYVRHGDALMVYKISQ
jgi:outer membrane protein assembly factor BamB